MYSEVILMSEYIQNTIFNKKKIDLNYSTSVVMEFFPRDLRTKQPW